ncbi:MAG: hypothetical protein WBO00_11790, partial [Steroidobacteraceae bacterium]
MAIGSASGYASPGSVNEGASMPQPDISVLYGAHLRAMTARADRALAAQGYDGLIIASGSLRYLYLDDNSYPFKPNPRYRSWVPDGSPDCFIVYRPGGRPILVFHQPDDYWYLPPALPQGYWVGSFDLRVVRSPAELRQSTGGGGRWAVLGEPTAVTEGLGDHDPAGLTALFDYARAAKTPYEIECMARA